MAITMINPFVIPEDQERKFLRLWKQDADRLSRATGFINTRLHRNKGSKDRTFLYVNVALWESEDDYNAAFQDFTPATHSVSGVAASPALYELAVEMGRPALVTS